MLRILCIGISFVFSCNVASQEYNLNDYKYVIVPEGYSFLTQKDKYQLNSMTRFLFKKIGFNAFNIAEGFPEDLKRNGCKALRVDLIKNSNFLYTRLSIELKDCNGKVVFVSLEGKSKEKEYKVAYQEALRQIFNDIVLKNYKYNGKSDRNVPGNLDSVTEVVETKEIIVSEIQSYVLNNTKYTFKKQPYGFEILEGVTSIGKSIKATRDNTYIVQTVDLSGYGYFDADLSFVVERVNPVTNELIKSLFTVSN